MKTIKCFYKNPDDEERTLEFRLSIGVFELNNDEAVEQAIRRKIGPSAIILGIVYPKVTERLSI